MYFLSVFDLKRGSIILTASDLLQPWDKKENRRGEPFDGRKEKEKARRKEKEGSCSEKGERFFPLTHKLSQ